MRLSERLTVIDLFAGCGGLALGLEMAGFAPIFANELNDDARATYLTNRERRFPLLRKYFSKDINDVLRQSDFYDEMRSGFFRDYGLSKKRSIDLVAGGPPCQGYSTVGMRRSYDVEKKLLRSNHLYKRMIEFISKVRPKAFLFENVEGLLSSRWTANGSKGEIFDDVLSAFQSIPGYAVKYALVHSRNYGVPQNRPRVLIVGFRSDVFEGKSKTLDAVTGGFLPQGSNGYPDLVDVLSDLVDPHFLYGGRTSHYPRLPESPFQERARRFSRQVSEHCCVNYLEDQEYSNHSEKTQRKFAYMIRTGGSIHHMHQTKKFRQRLLPKRWGAKGPNITITSLPDDFVHFDQARSLTVREYARIQTFPDWYRFVGPRTTGGLRRAGNPLQNIFSRNLPKYTQIANAVPVDLAHAVGIHLASILRARA
jgi:DNA (cytosine-5)-methyltransferase 1